MKTKQKKKNEWENNVGRGKNAASERYLLSILRISISNFTWERLYMCVSWG